VHVSVAHEEALVRFRPGETTETDIKDSLRGLGYTIRDPSKVQSFEEQEALMRREKRNLLTGATSAVLAFVVMLAMWLDLLEMRDCHMWLAWAAATFVFFRTGRLSSSRGRGIAGCGTRRIQYFADLAQQL
jgi:cation transport ATPase